MSSIYTEDEFFASETNSTEKDNQEFHYLDEIVSTYKDLPYCLKKKEAEIMYASYLASNILKKYGEENIVRFLQCHGINWRSIWNQIHEGQKEFHLKESE